MSFTERCNYSCSTRNAGSISHSPLRSALKERCVCVCVCVADWMTPKLEMDSPVFCESPTRGWDQGERYRIHPYTSSTVLPCDWMSKQGFVFRWCDLSQWDLGPWQFRGKRQGASWARLNTVTFQDVSFRGLATEVLGERKGGRCVETCCCRPSWQVFPAHRRR